MADVIKMRCVNKSKELSVLADELKEALVSELVCDERRLNDYMIMLCFEEFYFRCSSYVGLSIVLTEDSDSQDVIIAGFGGGDGLLNISWGANKSFAKRAAKELKKSGFDEVE